MNRYILQDVMIHHFLCVYWKYPYEFKLDMACFLGNLVLVKLIINLEDPDDLNWGLWATCHGGHRNITKFLILKGANDWNLGLMGACYGEHRDMTEWMIELGADPTKCYQNSGSKHCHPK